MNAESPTPAGTPAPRLLSVPEVAALLRVDPKTLRRWRTTGDLPPAIEIGGILRWRSEDLNSWLASKVEQRRGA